MAIVRGQILTSNKQTVGVGGQAITSFTTSPYPTLPLPLALALDALLLLTDVSQAAGAGRPLLRAGGDVALALKGLHAAMLNRPIAPAAEEEEEVPASPRAAEAREKQHTKWAALLRAVKDVLAAASSDGARKTD